MISRWRFLTCFALLFLVCVWQTAPAFPLDSSEKTSLQQSLTELAVRARPGLLGITVLDLNTGAQVRIRADRAYPMMSVFKASVAATVLAQVDAGHLSLEQKVTLTRADIVDGSAVPSIGAHFHGDSMAFTVNELLSAAVSESDNTAADALVRLVGGPKVITAFLRSHGMEGMRVDLDEAGVDRIFQGTDHGEQIPANETAQETLARRRRGYRDYLSDPRNRTTPDAAAELLKQLWKGQLLSSVSTQHLLQLMYDQTVPHRLRAGLPNGVRLADKCGTSVSFEGETAAYNDIGIMTWPNGHTVIVAAFLTASRADKAERDALYAEITRSVVRAVMH
ncbi:class A beta-lactamase [Dyella nitratireducens]|uniref:Beta-lactamase n=1 Tax=Dyella nitratireducens TaxID=1849580 RepID=A0ABQ1FQY3_9GAMM|nr:class A beta-lactamase [Dyella nitratireducens]GGA27250.1 beta-lactamase [Dyella nitratireducens]GLQ43441.1 beta-lactamase [Dyella nitratireducens]